MATEWETGEPGRKAGESPEDERSAQPKETEETWAASIKPPRSSQKSHRRYMRDRLTADLPAIANALLDAARLGKLPELKMAVQMSGLDQKKTAPKHAKRHRGRSFEEMLMEGLRKESVDGDGFKEQGGSNG